MKKSHHLLVWLKKMVLAQHNCIVCGDFVNGTTTLCTCKKECNKHDLKDKSLRNKSLAQETL
jgi:hypothetical protein